jgi:hypothetical protein
MRRMRGTGGKTHTQKMGEAPKMCETIGMGGAPRMCEREELTSEAIPEARILAKVVWKKNLSSICH